MVYENDFTQLAYYLVRTLEGHDVTKEAHALLYNYGFVDEDGSWKEDD